MTASTANAREGGLLAWQWRYYALNHRDRLSLWIHLIAVPMFIGGILAAVSQAIDAHWFGALVALVFALVAFALQGIAHKRERVPSHPFDGPGDFIARVFAEQFITFPRFVLTGGWMRNMTRPPETD